MAATGGVGHDRSLMGERAAQLRGENERREDAVHTKGACTHQLQPQFELRAFLLEAVDTLGIREQWELRVEQLRSENYDLLDKQIAAAEEQRRREALTKGINGQGGPVGL